MMNPRPSVGTVYNILLSDEKQRQVSAGTQSSSNSASFTAGVLNSTSTPSNTAASKPNFSSKVTFESTRSSGVCKYCKKSSHSIYRCYKMHGFPPNFRSAKNLGPKDQLIMLSLLGVHILHLPVLALGTFQPLLMTTLDPLGLI